MASRKRASRALTETPKVEIHIKEDPRPAVIHTLAAEPAQVPDNEEAKVMGEARYQKRRATEDWIRGRMTTRDHEAVHRRANHVLAQKDPRTFKGRSGENKPKKGGLY